MTDVNKSKAQLINSEEEARALYKPASEKYHGKVGLEVEMPLYKAGEKGPQIPTANEMMQMASDLKAKGFDAQLEASGVLEYASNAVLVKDVAQLVKQVEQDISDFEDTAASYGYTRAPFSILPTTTPEEALRNKVSRERLEVAIAVLTEIYPEGITNVPLLTTGVQVSLSPKDDDEMFRMARRGYMLTPLLIGAMGSSSGFATNDNHRQDVHLRSKYYEGYGASGGISQAFLESSNAEELVKNHVREVFDAPMFFAYDKDGSLIRSKKDDVLTFRKLVDRGLNTLSNFELAETFLYNDIKIANLRDGQGQVVGKRVEVRAADAGIHQPVSTLLLTAAVVPDGKTADAFDALLADYGFTGDPKKDAPLIKAAHKAAVEHGGKFMDVPFGNGNLRDFAADVASLVSAHYENDKAIAPEISKLTEILLTGESDAKQNAAKYPTLQDAANDLLRMAQPKSGRRAAPGAKNTP